MRSSSTSSRKLPVQTQVLDCVHTEASKAVSRGCFWCKRGILVVVLHFRLSTTFSFWGIFISIVLQPNTCKKMLWDTCQILETHQLKSAVSFNATWISHIGILVPTTLFGVSSSLTAGLPISDTHTKSQFADKPEGLRHFRYHHWKALGKENSDLFGLFLLKHYC